MFWNSANVKKRRQGCQRSLGDVRYLLLSLCVNKASIKEGEKFSGSSFRQFSHLGGTSWKWEPVVEERFISKMSREQVARDNELQPKQVLNCLRPRRGSLLEAAAVAGAFLPAHLKQAEGNGYGKMEDTVREWELN